MEAGEIKITKTIDADNITEEEYEGALTFSVKTADDKWLNKDGSVSDTEVLFTLKNDFDRQEDGTYVLTIKDVEVGKYTVTEENSAVEGYKLVTEKSTTEGEAEVTKGETAEVDLVDAYEKELGKIEITKTIDAENITEEQ